MLLLMFVIFYITSLYYTIHGMSLSSQIFRAVLKLNFVDLGLVVTKGLSINWFVKKEFGAHKIEVGFFLCNKSLF